MKAEELNLRDLLQFDPEHGKVSFGSSRMVLVGVDLMGSLVDGIIDVGDVTMAKVLLRRCGEQAGHKLATLFAKEFVPDNQQEWLALGPTMHAWEGAGKPSLATFEHDPAAGHFLLEVHFADSYFAEHYLANHGTASEPICWMLAGYIGGYCAEVFQMDLLCRETSCKAEGNAFCTFVVKPRDAWLG